MPPSSSGVKRKLADLEGDADVGCFTEADISRSKDSMKTLMDCFSSTAPALCREQHHEDIWDHLLNAWNMAIVLVGFGRHAIERAATSRAWDCVFTTSRMDAPEYQMVGRLANWNL